MGVMTEGGMPGFNDDTEVSSTGVRSVVLPFFSFSSLTVKGNLYKKVFSVRREVDLG